MKEDGHKLFSDKQFTMIFAGAIALVVAVPAILIPLVSRSVGRNVDQLDREAKRREVQKAIYDNREAIRQNSK